MSEISRAYMQDVAENGGAHLLTREEEIFLIKKIKKNCKNSLEKLVYHNLRLVVKTAYKYKGCGVDMMDLVNEGNLGLITAAKKYKPSKGTKFSTYAGFWVRQKMLRYINNHGRTIRIPCHAYAVFSELKKEYLRLSETGKALPDISYLSKKLNCTKNKIKSLLPYLDPQISLNAEIGDLGEDTKADMFTCAQGDANSLLIKKERLGVIQNALAILSKRERYIIERRFGLSGDKKQTLEAVGKKLNLTRERIRQIEKSALLKLKNILNREDIEL